MLRTLRGKRSFYSEMEKKCDRLMEGVKHVTDHMGLKVQLNHIGSMFQMFLSEEPVFDYASAKKSDSKRFMELHKGLLEKGVFLPPSQFETCFFSSSHSKDDIQKTIDAIEDSLKRTV